MAANFEKPGFPLNFRKVTESQRISSKSLRVMIKNLLGVPKDPPLVRTGLRVAKQSPIVEYTHVTHKSFPVENEQKKEIFKVLIKIDMDR